MEVAFEEGAGVLEVLFGVGFGGGEALKRFVQQADDPLLFGKQVSQRYGASRMGVYLLPSRAASVALSCSRASRYFRKSSQEVCSV